MVNVQTTGQAVRNLRQGHKVGRACHQKPPVPTILVNCQFEHHEQLRCTLNLVNDGAVLLADKAYRVGAYRFEQRRVIQTEVPMSFSHIGVGR